MAPPALISPALPSTQEVREPSPAEAIREPEREEPRAPVAPPPAIVVRETQPALAPPSPEPRAAAAPAPEQPRLIIGRMRVEVVPAPPPVPAPPVVRVVEKRSGAGRTGGVSSPLRFGLGQM
jgi:hypothetical protein